MEMNGKPVSSIESRTSTAIVTSQVKARRFGTLTMLAIVAAVTSGALLAQAPQTIGTWVSVGEVNAAVSSGPVVALPDNRTLIAGGKLADGTPTGAVTIYDPVDDSATAAGTLTSSRMDHTATLLQDGRVAVIGGLTADGLVSSDVEVFDPATGSSMTVAFLPEPRKGHVAAALPDGSVLIAGGATLDGVMLQTAVLFDPATASVSSLPGRLHTARIHASATTLLDGRVLVAGGSNGTAELASAEIYDRYSQSFSIAATQMSVGRQGHSAVLLPDNGGVLVAGGTSNGVTQTSVDLFLPAVFPDPFSYGEGEFTATGAMTAARAGAIAGPTKVEGYAFAAGGGSADAEVYRFATIKTDKDDYAPGELATITGSGWQPSEVVTLLFQEDPAVHDDYVLKVTANSAGNIYWNKWAPEEHDLNVRFYLTAHDSKSRAQITFTDSRTITSVTLNGGTSVTVAPGAAITAVVNVTTNNSGGNQNWRSTGWLIASAPGPMACVNHVDHDGSGSYSETFAITAPGSEGTHNAYFIAYQDDACSTQPSNTLTLTSGVTVAPVDTTKPTVTINSATVDPTNAVTIPVAVTFSEPVTNFTAGDLSIGNGTAGNFSGSGASYSFNLTPSGDGLVTVNIAAKVAQDAAGYGNEAAGQFSRTSDRTVPSISVNRSPLTNAFGWNNTDVTASYSASDALSGLDAGSPATGTFTFNAEGAGQSHTFTVTDLAGNSASATISNVNIDKTAPTVSATPAPAANTNGWNKTDVTVTFDGTDALSGIDSCQDPTVLSTEGANQSVSGSCTDKAGNSALAATASRINIDKTAPEISASRLPAVNAFGWNNTNVTASYSATDALSGLSSPASGSHLFDAEGAGQSHAFTVTDLAGNSASATISNVNIDKTAPAVTATPAPAANTNGWNNTNVTVTFAATDALSGIDSCQDPTVLSTEGAGQSAAGSCTDKAGNSTSASASGINIDKTAPSISASRLPAANAFGWNNTDVTTSYTASDALSGLSSPDSGSYIFSAEGTDQSHTFTVTDKAGNTTEATISNVNIDRTGPVVTATPAPAANANGWHNTNVTVTFDATDALSGLDSCQAATVLSTEGFGQSAAGSCTDKAGNSASASASGINIDKTAPSISASRLPAANAFGWNNTDVTASYTASDALSELSSLASGTYVFSAEGLGQSHTFTVTDKAGNSASASIADVKIDKTAPTLSAAVSPNPVVLNGRATATPTASDALSGVQSQSCPSVNSGSVGAKTLTCSATDYAGNTRSLVTNYSVVYAWDGFLQPINDTAHQIGTTHSKFKLGQTVPVKFVLRDAAGLSVQQTVNPNFLMSGNLGSCSSYTTLETTDPVTPDVSPVFKWDGTQYHFNWSTKGLSSGVYRIYAKLADDTQPWVDICLTK